MNIDIVRLNYQRPRSEFFQGTQSELEEKMRKGYRISHGSNGSYRLYRLANAELVIDIGDETKKFYIKDLIKEEYGMKKLTEKAVYRLCDEIEKGKKTISYTEEEGIKIIKNN